MDLPKTLRIEPQDMLDLSGNLSGLINSVVSVSRNIFALTEMKQPDLKYLCVIGISNFIFLKAAGADAVNKLSDDNKKMLGDIIAESNKRLGIALPREGRSPSEEELRNELKEEEEKAKDVEEGIELEIRGAEDIIKQLDIWLKELSEKKEQLKDKPFLVKSILEDILNKMKGYDAVLQKGVATEAGLMKKLSELLDEIKTIDDKMADNGIRTMLMGVLKGRLPGLDPEKVKDTEKALAQDPKKYRNALFLQLLLPPSVSKAGEGAPGGKGDMAWADLCAVISGNQEGVNDRLNKYFEYEKQFWVDMQKYKMESIRKAFDELKRPSELLVYLSKKEKTTVDDVANLENTLIKIKGDLENYLKKIKNSRMIINYMVKELEQFKGIVKRVADKYT